MKNRRLVASVAIVLFVLFAGSAFAAAAPVPPQLVKQFGSAQID
jgi:hypothetical protein